MHRDLRVEQVSEVIKRNSNMVYRLAFSMVKTVQDAEDIHQEVFIRYIRKCPQFVSNEHEKAWFIRVTVNLCKNLWKTAWRQNVVSMDAFETEETGTDSVGSFQVQSMLTEAEENVVETVKRLSLKYRVVIHLFYYEEMSIEEIADYLKLKPSNVRTRLTRARRMLKDLLKEDM